MLLTDRLLLAPKDVLEEDDEFRGVFGLIVMLTPEGFKFPPAPPEYGGDNGGIPG